MITRSARERRVFVDSSAYLAVLDRRDEHHQEALAITDRLVQGRYRLFTTNTVIIEAHALILSTMGITQASAFLRETESSRIVMILTRASDEELARQIIFRYQDNPGEAEG